MAGVMLAAAVLTAGPAAAFQEVYPVVPVQGAPGGADAVPGLAFDLETGSAGKASKVEPKDSGGLLPKSLDFGLELLYGAPAPDGARAPGIGSEITDDDLKILGKIKRRF